MVPTQATPPFDFQLPGELEAREPPEVRGLARDHVRLMVSYCADDRVAHAGFCDLPTLLHEGDLLVINTSATLPAALAALRSDGQQLFLHVSTILGQGNWIVELRMPSSAASEPFLNGIAGEMIILASGARATLRERHSSSWQNSDSSRLWFADVELPSDWLPFLQRHGAPIRYRHVGQPWPLHYYQTVYAKEPGSAEMPSAGRAFSREVIGRLAAKGIRLAPLVLHTGVSSPEWDEPLCDEYYSIPMGTADRINQTRVAGGRVVAVGTSTLRALETVADEHGQVEAASGWTSLLLNGRRRCRAVDGLLTGFHEAQASHIGILESIADRHHLELAYKAAVRNGYLWHEFGDLHLILRS